MVFSPYFWAVDLSTETVSASKNGVGFRTVKPRLSSNFLAATTVAAAVFGAAL